MIKGKNNASAIGSLVELSSGYLMLVKMNDATATSTVEGFSAALNGMPLAARKSMTYDQGKEMTWHAETNENPNRLVRQFLPKGSDLSKYTQEELDKFAFAEYPTAQAI